MADKDKSAERFHESLNERLLDQRMIMISGEVSQRLSERVISQLLVLDGESNDPIRVIINSPGGHVESGFAIYDVMNFTKSPITAVGAGWVASVAVPIMLGAPKGRRFALPNTRFLIHQPWTAGGGGPASDISIIAQELLKTRDRLNKLLAEETGQSIEKIAADSDRDFWMTAEEAVSYGLVNKVVSTISELE